MCSFEQNSFKNPPREYAVAYAWCWNAPITEEVIDSTLADLKKAGIGAVYAIPEPKEFRPNTMNNNMSPGYLTEEYFEIFKYFVSRAKEAGLTVWLYDEAGWPSGSAGSQISKMRPDLARHHIRCLDIPLSRGMEYTPPKHQKTFLAAFRKDKQGNFTRIHDPFVHDGESAVLEYRCLRVNFRVDHDVENDTDLLNPETTKLFLELTHERYKKALGDDWGTYLKYIFDDEAATEPFVWTFGFEKEFYQEYGYDILDHLPVIRNQVPADTEERQNVLSDWRKMVSKLLIRNYFKPIQDWCRENGIMSIGHIDNDHSAESFITWLPCYAKPLEALRCFDVPGVDVICRHIFPEGLSQIERQESDPFFPRFASSAAAQAGTGLALTESMAVYGEGTTQAMMRYVFGAQAVRGINVFNCNSFETGIQPIRPLFSAAMPGYEHLPAINKYLSRLSYLTQLGTAECPNALYWPCEDMSRGGSTDAFRQLGIALEKQGVYFDVIDDDFVRRAEIKNGCLCMGLAAYENVFVPACDHMPEDVKAKLAGFVGNAAVPVAECDNDNFRLMKRKLEDGSALYLIFNESKDTQQGTLTFAESRPGYRLWLEDGRIEPCNNFRFTLTMGETAVILFTSNPPANVQKAYKEDAAFCIDGNFSLKKTAEFFTDELGARKIPSSEPSMSTELGGWKAYLGKDFSGEATYTAQFRLEEAFLNGETYELDMGDVEYSVSVKLNGVAIGIAGFAPYTLRFNRGILREENTIELTVANTPANKTAIADVHSYLTHKETGSYEMQVAFSREFTGGGLHGPVVIKKLV